MWNDLGPRESLPAIDFGAVQVMGVILGNRSSGCCGVTVTRIVRTAEAVVVHDQESKPSPGTICAAAITTPYHLVAMTRSALPVNFVAD